VANYPEKRGIRAGVDSTTSRRDVPALGQRDARIFFLEITRSPMQLPLGLA